MSSVQPPYLPRVQSAVFLVDAHAERQGHRRHAGADDDARQRQRLGDGVYKIHAARQLSEGVYGRRAALVEAYGDYHEVQPVVHEAHADDYLDYIALHCHGVEADDDLFDSSLGSKRVSSSS